MNRRSFLKRAAGLAAVVATGGSILKDTPKPEPATGFQAMTFQTDYGHIEVPGDIASDIEAAYHNCMAETGHPNSWSSFYTTTHTDKNIKMISETTRKAWERQVRKADYAMTQRIYRRLLK